MSYTIPDASLPEFSDISYDGKRQDNLLTDGLGCLIDGEVGADNYKLDMGNGKGKSVGEHVCRSIKYTERTVLLKYLKI